MCSGVHPGPCGVCLDIGQAQNRCRPVKKRTKGKHTGMSVLGRHLVGGVALRAAERVGKGEAQLVLAHVPLQVVHAPQQLLPVRGVQRLGLGGCDPGAASGFIS